MNSHRILLFQGHYTIYRVQTGQAVYKNAVYKLAELQ